jgi:hypothetical protein
MLTTLICVARNLIPKLTLLGAELESQAAILAIGIFAFLFYRLYSRRRA